MVILQLFLQQKYDNGREDFGEGDGYFVGLALMEFFDAACRGSGVFDRSDYWWNHGPGEPGPRDLVCYLLPGPNRSIARNHTTDPLGAGGSTVWSTTAGAMISEIYMSATTGDAARSRLVANLIIHEWLHNKLDAHPSRSVLRDVHGIRGGSVSTGTVNSSMRPSAADIAAMRRGLGVAIPQFTAAMP
jgi:hypothetical protein